MLNTEWHGGVKTGSADHKRQSMANAKDVATVIQSALDEIGVTGKLEVSMDGQEETKPLGAPTGEERHVGVVVEDLTHPEREHKPER